MSPEVDATAELAPMFHVEHPRPDVTDASSFALAAGASDAETAELERFRILLEEGSRRMNLVGPSALAEFWPRHAWDSAQLLPMLGDARTVADIGAGAGFPGVVLAVLLKRRPGAHVHLIESVAKRGRFLQEVVTELQLPATVHNARAEALDPPPAVEVVTARACAPLPRLLEFAWPLLRSGARGLFLKGRAADEELAAARRAWRMTAHLVASRSDPTGRIVVVEKVARARG